MSFGDDIEDRDDDRDPEIERLLASYYEADARLGALRARLAELGMLPLRPVPPC